MYGVTVNIKITDSTKLMQRIGQTRLVFGRKEGNFITLNSLIRLYDNNGTQHMVKDHSDSKPAATITRATLFD